MLALLGLVYLCGQDQAPKAPDSAGSTARWCSRGRWRRWRLIAGWVTTEVGRQPWVVYRVMPTADAVTGAGGIPVGYNGAGRDLTSRSRSPSHGSCAGSRGRRSSSHPGMPRRRRDRGLPAPGEAQSRARLMLQTIPLIFVLAGLVLYVSSPGGLRRGSVASVAGGSRGGEQSASTRTTRWHRLGGQSCLADLVLTVTWTAYPTFFGSIASTLGVALFIAGLGIILRGAGYALRAGTTTRREVRAIDTAFAIASLVTPFALGAAAGGIASERRPVGNAAGHLITSWLNPTSILIGALAVASSGYLAAVYLAADAARVGDRDLEDAFPRGRWARRGRRGRRARGARVLHSDAHRCSRALPWRRVGALVSRCSRARPRCAGDAARFEAARYSGAAAVAAVIAAGRGALSDAAPRPLG